MGASHVTLQCASPTRRQPPTTGMSTRIFDINPYENHPGLTQTEAEVLWEYAKLNQRLKIVSVLTFFFFAPLPYVNRSPTR